jgi:hypothetical protein
MFALRTEEQPVQDVKLYLASWSSLLPVYSKKD